MADFNWYLSRQGIRGLTGAKGDQGFSPVIEEGQNTLETYTLKITNEFEEFETPNLRGSFSIEDQGGKYVTYDATTGNLIASDLTEATAEELGAAKIATEDDYLEPQQNAAKLVNPYGLINAMSGVLDSPDESVVIRQNPDTLRTELTVNPVIISGDVAEERAARVAADNALRDSINTVSSNLQSTNSRVTSISTDLNTEKQVRLAADQQQQSLIDAERRERETQDASLQTQLGEKLTADNIKAGNNITISKSGNNVTINSTGGGGGSTYTAGDGINISGDVISTRVDNQTIKIQDGVLHADLSEIGDELNSLSGRVNTLEGEVVVATNDKIGMVKPDGTTIRINSDGVISSVGGGSVPEVDNVTIEINEDGKLQTTVDINELQEKVEDLQLYKFPNATIIGEPTINNGQISGFSSANYLQFPFEFETKGRTWLLNGSFHTGSDVTTQQNIIDSLASVALAVRGGWLVMALSTNGTTFDLGEHISMSDIEPNTTYFFRISFSGTKYLLSLSTDKIDYMPEAIVESSTPIASRPMTISSSGHPYGSTINLNDWDLTVANTLVWQGMDDVGIASRMDVNASNATKTAKVTMLNTNTLESGVESTSDKDIFNEVSTRKTNAKTTGQDLIQTGDFETVGSPTIDVDGVVSGLTNANYLNISKNIAFGSNNWSIISKIRNVSASGSQSIISGYQDRLISLYLSNNKLVFNIGNGTAFVSGAVTGTTTLLDNTEYWIKLTFDGSSYNSYISTDGVTYTLEASNTNNITIPSGNYNIGVSRILSDAFKGSIDLSKFKIFINDKLIYQPYVRIPYTQSKTNSKIVSPEYKKEINDLYELTGQALYYVLDSENESVTLPKGDIYGMITNLNDKLSNIADMLDVETIARLVAEINGNAVATAATPMMLSLEPNELDVEDSFSKATGRATFSSNLGITSLKEESYDDDDTDIDLGGTI